MNMRLILFSSAIILLSIKSFTQELSIPLGYKLIRGPEPIKVYQDLNGSPILDKFNFWSHGYWFKTDIKMLVNGVEYTRITIPTAVKWNKEKEKYEPLRYSTPIQWTQNGAPVDSDDFNSWMWIVSSDLENKVPYYGKLKKELVFSGITVPFRYRPITTFQPNNLIDSDLNLGSFIGYTIDLGNKVDISAGISLALGSLNQNAANNFAITTSNSQLISGFIYGAAVVLDWQKKFQIGGVLGYDHAVGGLSRSYIYQDKYWVALSLNYQFLDFGKSKGPVQSSETKNMKPK